MALAAGRRSILYSLASAKNWNFRTISRATPINRSSILTNSIINRTTTRLYSSGSKSKASNNNNKNCEEDWNPQRVNNYSSLLSESREAPIESGDEKHWFVTLTTTGLDFPTEEDLFDHYVDTLALVLPRKDKVAARKKIYLVSCKGLFGFGAKFNMPTYYKIIYLVNVFFVEEDRCYASRNKETVLPVPRFTPLNWNYRFNDIYSYYHLSKRNPEWNFDHWIVHLKFPDWDSALGGMPSLDYCVRFLAKVVGSKVRARKKIYAVWCKMPFGFGAEIDEKTANYLEALQDVLTVLPDHSFDVKNKYNQAALMISPPLTMGTLSRYGYIHSDRPVTGLEE